MRRRHAERDPGGLDLAPARARAAWPSSARARGTRARSPPCSSPPSVRSVSATWASSASAGWQQVKMQLEPLVGDRRLVHLVLHGLAARRAGASSPRACDRGGCGRSRGCAPSSPARRAGCRASRRAASARPRSRTPPARPPRRARSRRGSRSASRRRGPTRRGRPARGSLPLRDRAHLDRAAEARRRDARGELDRGVEVVGLEQQVAAERLLDRDERPVGRQRPAVLARGRWSRSRAARSCRPGLTPGGLVDRLVVGVRRRSARPRRAATTPPGRAGSGRRPGGSAACTSWLPPARDGRL